MRHQAVLKHFSLPQHTQKKCQWQNTRVLTQRPLRKASKSQFWTLECQKGISPDAFQNIIYLTNSNLWVPFKIWLSSVLIAVFQTHLNAPHSSLWPVPKKPNPSGYCYELLRRNKHVWLSQITGKTELLQDRTAMPRHWIHWKTTSNPLRPKF